MNTQPTPVDPPELYQNPAFTQGMILPAGRTLYVGGQNGADGTGTLLDGLGAQTEQALRNLLAVLAEAGTDPEHVAKLTIYLDPSVIGRLERNRNGAIDGDREHEALVVVGVLANQVDATRRPGEEGQKVIRRDASLAR